VTSVTESASDRAYPLFFLDQDVAEPFRPTCNAIF
jgi:hypothetical protein